MTTHQYRNLLQAVRHEQRNGATDETKHERVILGIYSIRHLKGRYTIRIRVPVGILNAVQLSTLADIVETEASNHVLHITTRHGLELGGVKAYRLRSVLKKLSNAGLTTNWTGGNGIRGIVCCPLSGEGQQSIFDVSSYAAELDDLLQNDIRFQSMPRKIKIAFESCSVDHVRTSVTDIGIRAIRSTTGLNGFQLLIGGGLGAVPKRGQVLESFTSATLLLPTIHAILQVFNQFGNRTNRSRARIKWLIAEKGWPWFINEVFSIRGQQQSQVQITSIPGNNDSLPPNLSLGLMPEYKDENFSRWVMGNVFSSANKNHALVNVFCPLGELTPSQIRFLSQILIKSFNSAGIILFQKRSYFILQNYIKLFSVKKFI